MRRVGGFAGRAQVHVQANLEDLYKELSDMSQTTGGQGREEKGRLRVQRSLPAC